MSTHASAKLSRREKEALLPQVQQLAQAGLAPRAIAEKLGKKLSVIERCLRDLQPPAARRARQKAILAARIVRLYKKIYLEALREWGRTLRGKAETAPRPSGSYALLSKAMDALKAVREIRGLDARRQTEIASEGGTPIQPSLLQVDDLSCLSDEELCALEVRLRAERESPADEEPQE
jgi:hypothetical protein